MLIFTFSFFRISSSISKIKTLGSVFSFECACISYITDKHFVMRIHIFCKWYIWILGRFYPDRPSDVYLEIQYLQLVQTLFAMASSKVILYGIWYFVSQNKSFPVFRSIFVYISFLYVIINVIFESLRKIFGDAEYTYTEEDRIMLKGKKNNFSIMLSVNSNCSICFKSMAFDRMYHEKTIMMAKLSDKNFYHSNMFLASTLKYIIR